MDISDWVVAAIAVLSLISTVFIGARSLRASERAAKAAEVSAESAGRSVQLAASQLESSASAQAESLRLGREQLESSVQAQQDSLQPYIWADLRPREDGVGAMMFVIGNSGPTVATNVRVEFQPALTHIVPSSQVANANHIQDRLREGLSSLAPGRVFMWGLGVTWDYFNQGGTDPAVARSLEVAITADGPFGPIAPLSYSIALDDLEHQELRPVGLGLVEAPLVKIEKRIMEIGKMLDRRFAKQR